MPAKEWKANMVEMSKSIASRARAARDGLLPTLKYQITRRRHQWLSGQIQRELRQARLSGMARPQSQGLPSTIGTCLSSQRGLLLGAAIVVLVHALFAFAMLPLVGLLKSDPNGWQGFISDLWQVEASILGLTYVVAVLLIQTRAGDSSSGDLFQLYVHESGVVPVAAAGLVIVCLAGLTRLATVQVDWSVAWLRALTVATVPCFVGFVALNIVIYWRTLVFMSPSSMQRMRTRLLERAIQDAVARTVQLTVGRALFRRACEESGLLCDPWAPLGHDLAPVRAGVAGHITDIDLARVKSFAERLQHTVYTVPGTGKACKAIVLRDLGSTLNPSHDVLVRVHPADLTDDAIRDLRAAFKTSSAVEDPNDSLVSALAQLKEQASTYLREGRVRLFDESLGQYLHVFERLLAVWHGEGLPVSVASSPLGDLGRSALSTLTCDPFDIIRWSLQTQDPEVIGSAMYLPIRMMRTAAEFGEVGLYHTLGNMMVAAYRLAAVDQQNKARDFAVERSWRYVQEWVHFWLFHILEQDTTSDDELAKLGACLTPTVLIYNRLLKAAIEHQDVSSFEAFGAAMDGLLQGFDPDHIVADGFDLEWRLENATLSDQDRKHLEARLARYKLLERMKQQAEETIGLAWFGLSAWLLRQIQGGKVPLQAGGAMLALARDHLPSMGSLSSLYLHILGDTTNGLDWDGWVLEELPEGKAHFIDTQSWMRSFYCLQGLRLTPKGIASSSNPVVPDRRLEHEMAPLEETCRQLRASAEGLRDLISEQDIERIDSFLELHRMAIRVAQRDHEKWLVQQPISQAKVDAFRQDLLEAWHEHAAIRPLLTAHGSVVELVADELASSAGRCQIDVLIEKAFFVEDEYPLYHGFGSPHGHNLAMREDQFLLSRMTDGRLQELDCCSDKLADGVKKARELLEQRGYQPDVVVLDASLWHTSRLRLRDHVGDRRSGEGFSELPGFVGALADLPVIAPGPIGFAGVLVADLDALGHLVQRAEQSGEGLSFRLDTIDEARAKQLLDQHPEFQRDLQLETREDALWQLQLRVHLLVAEYLDFQLRDVGAGILVHVRRNAEGSHE